MFNLISLQCVGLPWNTEWKISKPEKGTCKGLFHKQAVKSWTLTYVILKSQEFEQFAEAETLVSGIEYSSLMTTGDSASVEKRISGAIHAVLGIYGVPKDVREAKVQKVLTKDYRKLASQMLPKFKEFIDKANDAEFDRLVQAKREQLARSKR